MSWHHFKLRQQKVGLLWLEENLVFLLSIYLFILEWYIFRKKERQRWLTPKHQGLSQSDSRSLGPPWVSHVGTSSQGFESFPCFFVSSQAVHWMGSRIAETQAGAPVGCCHLQPEDYAVEPNHWPPKLSIYHGRIFITQHARHRINLEKQGMSSKILYVFSFWLYQQHPNQA